MKILLVAVALCSTMGFAGTQYNSNRNALSIVLTSPELISLVQSKQLQGQLTNASIDSQNGPVFRFSLSFGMDLGPGMIGIPLACSVEGTITEIGGRLGRPQFNRPFCAQ